MKTNPSSKQVQPELEPCPNLDCRSAKVAASNDWVNHYVYCSECFLRGPRESTENLGAKWNALPRLSATSTAPGVEDLPFVQRMLNALDDLRGHFGPGNCWCDGDGSDESPHLFCCTATRGLYNELRQAAATASPAAPQDEMWAKTAAENLNKDNWLLSDATQEELDKVARIIAAASPVQTGVPAENRDQVVQWLKYAKAELECHAEWWNQMYQPHFKARAAQAFNMVSDLETVITTATEHFPAAVAGGKSLVSDGDPNG